MIRYITLFFFLASSLARAELVFETLTVDGGKAQMSDKQFTAEFPFKNTGDSTVKILSINSSCGCTTPTLEKKDYAPGESGVITAKFDFGPRTGYQEKKITVITDGAEDNERTVLKLAVTIPQIVNVEPRVLTWKEEQPLPKSVKITLGEGLKATVRIKEPTPAGFEYTLEPATEEGVDYLLTFKPLDGDNKRAKVDLEVVDERGEVIATSFTFGIIR